MNWLKNKNVLITGASSGVGKGLALDIIDDVGQLHAVSSNRHNRLDKLEQELKDYEGKVFYYRGDICNLQFMEEVVKLSTDKQLDAFVHCAGGTDIFGRFETMTYDEITHIIDVNVTATLCWLRCLVPLMRKNYCTTPKRAHVLLMSSRSGERTLPRLCPYTVAKGGVEKIAETLQKEYASDQVAFTLVNPGSIDTAFVENWRNREAADAHTMESMKISDVVPFMKAALETEVVINKISMESMLQWQGELGVLNSSGKVWEY